MSTYQSVARAYKSAVDLRSQRERDAEVFEVFASRLREGEKEGGIVLAKALADNNRLWRTVITLLADDNNPQPVAIRKSMLGLANTVLAEMARAEPNIRELAETNGNIAAGLRGVSPAG
jgi:flagellar biosynthesis regulator FlaF